MMINTLSDILKLDDIEGLDIETLTINQKGIQEELDGDLEEFTPDELDVVIDLLQKIRDKGHAEVKARKDRIQELKRLEEENQALEKELAEKKAEADRLQKELDAKKRKNKSLDIKKLTIEFNITQEDLKGLNKVGEGDVNNLIQKIKGNKESVEAVVSTMKEVKKELESLPTKEQKAKEVKKGKTVTIKKAEEQFLPTEETKEADGA